MNPISTLMNPKSRKAAYFVYGIIGLGLGATQTVLAVYGQEDLKSFIAATGVYAYLGTAFGFVAGNNVETEPLPPVAPPESVETDLAPEDEEVAPVALVNDTDPTEEGEETAPTGEADEVDETPVPEDYRPRH